MQAVRQGRTWQGTGTWQQSPNASEKIDSFPRRLAFSLHICYFSSILFGGIQNFRIFANGWAGITIAHLADEIVCG